jgi:trigger factor
MMPGQEKMVMEFYKKNPSALASLRGTVYEEKIVKLIKTKAKPNKKEISKEEAEKILKEAHNHEYEERNEEKKALSSKTKTSTKAKKTSTKTTKTKKVSKK